MLNMLRQTQAEHGIEMEKLYDKAGISRQGFFQSLVRQEAKQEMVHQITNVVNDYRRTKDRRAGARNMYYNLDIGLNYAIGVNKFERLLSAEGLGVAPQHVRIITTKSTCQSWNYENLTKGLVINGINQLVVGDLTYIYLGKSLYYMFCLTDVYSSRIVGYHIGERMRAIEAKKAFDQWIKLRGRVEVVSCIHHTDGGSQYFSHHYMKGLVEEELQISVAANCLDNGFAEQRNGLLKYHLLPTLNMSNGKRLVNAIEKMMYYYNHERKQEALGWMSPVSFEKHWVTESEPMKMTIYNREEKIRTKRTV